MPANLPPEYFDIEKRYRDAGSNEEKIDLLEELLSVIPKHKGTEKLRGNYRARLAKLKSSMQGQKSKRHVPSTFYISREGAGQVLVIGCTNTGKSTLVKALTNAEPEIAATPYTTWEPLPGMLEVEKVPIQLVDTPSLDRPYIESELLHLVRRADLVLLVIDLKTDPFRQFDHSLELLEEYRIVPAPLAVDPLPERWTAVPLLVLANKCDEPQDDLDCQAFCELVEKQLQILPVSALSGRNLERLKQEILQRLDVIRVYARPPGEEPDLSAPFVLKAGSTLEDLRRMIHKDFLQNLKYARVWGSTVHDGQKVAFDYVLHDGDIVELRL